jgi:hypothetical protein
MSVQSKWRLESVRKSLQRPSHPHSGDQQKQGILECNDAHFLGPRPLPLFLPITAKAAEVSLSFGAIVASEYVSAGIGYSDGVTFQPYVELGCG